MSWYYYSGQKPVAIPVGDGEVRSVRPHSKVEITPSSANDVQIRTLSKLGTLRRCGAPQKPQAVTKVEKGTAPPPKSGPGEALKFHEFLVDEGKTRKGRPTPDETVAPVDRKSGDGEEKSASSDSAPAEGEGGKVADADAGDVQEGEEPKSGSRSKRKTRRRRSTS